MRLGKTSYMICKMKMHGLSEADRWVDGLVSSGYWNTLPKPGGLKHQPLTLSRLWSPEVQSQGVGEDALGEDPSHPFQLLMTPGIPWLVATSLQFLPLPSRGLLLSFPLGVSYKDTCPWM